MESHHMSHLYEGDNAATHPVGNCAQPDAKVDSKLSLAEPIRVSRRIVHFSLSARITSHRESTDLRRTFESMALVALNSQAHAHLLMSVD
jgi:hypothetical protein